MKVMWSWEQLRYVTTRIWTSTMTISTHRRRNPRIPIDGSGLFFTLKLPQYNNNNKRKGGHTWVRQLHSEKETHFYSLIPLNKINNHRDLTRALLHNQPPEIPDNRLVLLIGADLVHYRRSSKQIAKTGKWIITLSPFWLLKNNAGGIQNKAK